LRKGYGVSRDESASRDYMKRLEAHPDGNALNEIGVSLRYGIDLPIDRVEAVR
jgi:hypothetical protein